MAFFKSKYFVIGCAIQILGLVLLGLGTWANIIQYVSGFGMILGVYGYIEVHREEMKILRQQIAGLHTKHDEMRQSHEELGYKLAEVHKDVRKNNQGS